MAEDVSDSQLTPHNRSSEAGAAWDTQFRIAAGALI